MMSLIAPHTFTYGAEIEWADIDRRKPLPLGTWGWQIDHTVANSNGIAVMALELYPFGGEIQTKPTRTVSAQVEHFKELLAIFPEARVNHHCNLHVHIQVPTFRDNLALLKQVQAWNSQWLPEILPLIEPIPKPIADEYPDHEALIGALKRYQRRLRSHQTILPTKRVAAQLEAKSCQAFFENEVPRSSKNGKPFWYFQPRAAVNLRQLLTTDTIEFRHFPGTLSPVEFETALLWCKGYLDLAINHPEKSPVDLYRKKFLLRKFPTFVPYDHVLEQRYQKTYPAGKQKSSVLQAIAQVLQESQP